MEHDSRIIERVFERLLEAAIDPSSAVNQGIALYTSSNDMFDTHILYKTGTRVSNVSLYNDIVDGLTDTLTTAVRPAFVGAIRVALEERGPSYVDGVIAQKGFGPLLYDIALKSHGSLKQSPVSTSPSAQRVWDYYKSKRKDVIYTANPPTIKLRPGAVSGINTLRMNHESFVEKLENEGMRRGRRFSAAEFEAALRDVARDALGALNM